MDILKFTSDELTDEKLKELIVKKESFCVVAVKNMSYTVNKIEGAIEKQSLRCRVYMENRKLADNFHNLSKLIFFSYLV